MSADAGSGADQRSKASGKIVVAPWAMRDIQLAAILAMDGYLTFMEFRYILKDLADRGWKVEFEGGGECTRE